MSGSNKSLIARIGFWAAVLGLLALLAAGPGYRFGIFPLQFALFGMMTAAVALGALGALLSLIGAIIVARRSGMGTPFLGAILGLIIGGAAVLLPMSQAQKAQSVPPIHDISTDTEYVPEWVALAEARAAAPNGAEYGTKVPPGTDFPALSGSETAAKQKEAYPDLSSMTVASDPAAVITAATAIAESMGWEVAASDPASGRLEATDTTFWFGFKDDVIVRAEGGEAGTIVDMRSKSRIGVSDVGKNAERIRAFQAALKDKLGG